MSQPANRRQGEFARNVVADTYGLVVETTAGRRVRVWEGKSDKYRETPVPQTIASTIDAYADVRDAGPDVP